VLLLSAAGFPAGSRCLDHVVAGAPSLAKIRCPQPGFVLRGMQTGKKKDHAAEDFLRELYREGRLSRKGPQRSACGLAHARGGASCGREVSSGEEAVRERRLTRAPS